MDWKQIDWARRAGGPIEADLVEAYAKGKISRRNFVKRGTIIGLSVPMMGAVIAACGGSDGDSSGSTPVTGGSTPSTGSATANTEAGSGAQGGRVVWANQQGDSSTGLDPVNMLDLGTYNVLSQSFEPLVGVGEDGNIGATGLATEWSPNDTGDVWTFKLREGVKWQNGSDFTSADVAATMDRLVAKGNAALDGVIGEGAVDASDPLTAVFTLNEPNGNFPVLVSIFNAQGLITPVDYTDGTTLDGRPDGTGAWKLDNFDVSTSTSTFSRNPDWWGGMTPLDGIELRGFADIGTAVTAMQSREIDGIQQFSVIGGEGLLNDSNFVTLEPPSAAHREVWFNIAEGPFAGLEENRLVRQALAWCWDRTGMVQTLFNGRAVMANDYPVVDSLPFYDPDAVEQRDRDIDKAKQLLADSGATGITAEIKCGDLQEVPELAAIMKQNAAEIGIELTVNEQANATFYEDAWCPALYEDTPPAPGLPCGNSAGFGIIDYGHRPVPDVFLGSALATDGVWNSSNYSNPEFDKELTSYRTSVDVDGQKKAMGSMQKILWEDVPASYPYFYNYLSGHDASVSGAQATSLGHTILNKASKG